MRDYRFLFLFLFLFCVSCASTDTNSFSSKALPKFSYADGIVTHKKVNCSSGKAIDCMACALQGEAANQPAQGIYAVGVTIMTRAKGNTNKICKVTKSRRQFEGMKRRGYRKISKKVWIISRQVLARKETGWTHFWSPSAQARLKRSKPIWAYRYEARQCRREKIGDHVFYNENMCQKKALLMNASTK